MLALLQCPACRARLSGEEAAVEPCRRCGSDLGLLRQGYASGRRERELARRALAAGDPLRAVAHARRAVKLVDTPETRETLAAAWAAAGRPRRAAALLD